VQRRFAPTVAAAGARESAHFRGAAVSARKRISGERAGRGNERLD
jgi:hypothetical protein